MSHADEQAEFYSQLRLSRNKLATRALCHINSLNSQRDELLAALIVARNDLVAMLTTALNIEPSQHNIDVLARQAIPDSPVGKLNALIAKHEAANG